MENVINNLLKISYFSNLTKDDYQKSFNELGIDSVDIMQLYLEIEETLNVKVEPTVEEPISGFMELAYYLKERE